MGTFGVCSEALRCQPRHLEDGLPQNRVRGRPIPDVPHPRFEPRLHVAIPTPTQRAHPRTAPAPWSPVRAAHAACASGHQARTRRCRSTRGVRRWVVRRARTRPCQRRRRASRRSQTTPARSSCVGHHDWLSHLGFSRKPRSAVTPVPLKSVSSPPAARGLRAGARGGVPQAGLLVLLLLLALLRRRAAFRRGEHKPLTRLMTDGAHTTHCGPRMVDHRPDRCCTGVMDELMGGEIDEADFCRTLDTFESIHDP